MTDLSKYRLNSTSELYEIMDKIGVDRFLKYKESVYNLLRKFSIEEYYDVTEKIREENQEIFIKCACQYIIETKGDCNVEFIDYFSRIRGIQSFNAQEKERKLYKERISRKKGGFYD